MERLIRLYEEFGQSPWLDNLKRGYLTSGQLAPLRDGGIRGLTSNPTIFQKAIADSTDYDEQFRTLTGDSGPVVDDYWTLVIADIVEACDVFDPLYEASDGRDGFVSVEVAPDLADDSAGTEAAARGLHERIARRNLMVKIPGHRGRHRADPADAQRGPEHQHHADLQPRPPPRGDGRLPRRTRGVRRH